MDFATGVARSPAGAKAKTENFGLRMGLAALSQQN